MEGHHKRDFGAQDLFPTRLGARLCISPQQWRVNPEPLCWDILHQYPMRYRVNLGPTILDNTQVDKIYDLTIKRKLYTGSDGSEKEGIGEHAYGFTSGRMEGAVWGGVQQ